MRKPTIFGFYILIMLSFLLSGCGKQHREIILPTSSTAQVAPSAAVLPTPELPSSTPQTTEVPVQSSSPSATNPATSARPSTAVPSLEPSASKAPSTSPNKAAQAANVPSAITFNNAKGSAIFYIGMGGREAILAHAALTDYTPKDEDIDFIIDYPNDKGEYGSDGYYGGYALTGESADEITLHFTDKKLDFVEISDILETPIKTSFSIGSVNNNSSAQQAIAALGAHTVKENFIMDKLISTTYVFKGKNFLSLTYNTSGQLVGLFYG